VSMAAILWTPDSVILGVYVLQLWDIGRLPLVSALSVVIIVGFTFLTFAARALLQRRTIVAEI